MKHIASVSFGKDSLAMLLYILENNLPLDEVMFYDTGMEFQAIYNNRDKAIRLLEQKGVKYTEFKPKQPFLYTMLEHPHKSKKDGIVRYGYKWCGGACRWGTSEKLAALDRYLKAQKAWTYIGIAADEAHRLEKIKNQNKSSPIAQAGMSEADCLSYCREQGWNWIEQTTATESGDIDLYDILDRASCWCCRNKNLKELKNIYTYLPQYWEKLKDLQSKIDEPMKKYCNKEYGEYGNVFELEKIFRKEAKK